MFLITSIKVCIDQKSKCADNAFYLALLETGNIVKNTFIILFYLIFNFLLLLKFDSELIFCLTFFIYVVLEILCKLYMDVMSPICLLSTVFNFSTLRSAILAPSFFLDNLLFQSPLLFLLNLQMLNSVLLDVPNVYQHNLFYERRNFLETIITSIKSKNEFFKIGIVGISTPKCTGKAMANTVKNCVLLISFSKNRIHNDSYGAVKRIYVCTITVTKKHSSPLKTFPNY